MTMRGIDISNWQKGLDISKFANQIDFVIVKATEGLNYVDKQCNGFVSQAIANNKLWGTYHFAGNNDPVKEAEFYINNIKNYVGKGIMVLDIEDKSIKDYGAYADKFCTRVHELTGIWPMVYTYAYALPYFGGHTVTKNCGLWVAGYPKKRTNFDGVSNNPYGSGPWSFAAIWQFTSSGRMPGYYGDLDLDVAYMDKVAWNKYAGQTSIDMNKVPAKPTTKTPVTVNVKAMAYDVLDGKYGVGEARKKALGANYTAVQNEVNKINHLVKRIIRGELGNGNTRRAAVEALGYDYDRVQKIVNARV